MHFLWEQVGAQTMLLQTATCNTFTLAVIYSGHGNRNTFRGSALSQRAMSKNQGTPSEALASPPLSVLLLGLSESRSKPLSLRGALVALAFVCMPGQQDNSTTIEVKRGKAETRNTHKN